MKKGLKVLVSMLVIGGLITGISSTVVNARVNNDSKKMYSAIYCYYNEDRDPPAH